MKPSITALLVVLLCSLIVIGCKSKKEMEDPTQLELNVLVELNKGITPKRIIKDLPQFEISEFKPTNRTLNQYAFKVTLKGQSADEVLKAFNSKKYVKSAVLAPMGEEAPKNMPSSSSTKTKPIKG